MDDLFTDSDTAEIHPIYAAIRDSEHLRGDKSRLEAMWRRYHTYADKHFLREIKTNFIQRYWEMATTLALQDSGCLLKSEDTGPDIVVIGRDDTPLLYVECVAPTGGNGTDKIEEPDKDLFWVPHSDIILRYLSAVREKQKRYRCWLENGLIDPSLPFVIALNSRDIPMAVSDANPPRLVQAFYGIGTAYVQLDSRTLRVTGDGYTAKLTTHKRSGSEVSLGGFLTKEFQDVSAVLFACLPRNWIPDDPREEMTIAHNFMARNPLPKGWIDRTSEIWYTGSRVERTTCSWQE
jgi:type I restriction enzyme S subunit